MVLRVLGPLALVAQGVRAGHGISRTLRRHEQHHAAPAPAAQQLSWECYGQASVLPTFTRERFSFCQVVESEKALLYWDHDQSGSTTVHVNATLTVALVLRAGLGEGDWAALGISDEGSGMKGMDVALLWMDKKGPVLEDRFARAYEAPVVDDSQDKTLVEAVVQPSLPLTAFAFSMPASNCRDQGHDVRVRPGVGTFVTYAHGKGKRVPDNDDGDTTASKQRAGPVYLPEYHGPDARGGGSSLPLLIPKSHWEQINKKVTLPADTQMTRVMVHDFEVPSNRTTTYICTWFKPPTDRKYHVYDMRLVKGAAAKHKLMHHQSIFVAFTAHPKHTVGEPYDCSGQAVEQYSLPYAAGSESGLWTASHEVAEVLDAGYPIDYRNASVYWILELHYENPLGIKGIVDTAGYEISYSPTLRKHDIGMLVTGTAPSIDQVNLTASMAVAPGQPKADEWGMCSSVCLNKVLKNKTADAIPKRRVLYAGLHMHAAGTEGEILVEHPDGSREVLLQHKTFELRNAVGWRFFPTSLHDASVPHIGPGDRVLTRCTYNTVGRHNVTRWGPSALTDEMCFAFIWLAPMEDTWQLFGCLDANGMHHPVIEYWSHAAAVAQKASTQYVPLNTSICIEATKYTQEVEGNTLISPQSSTWGIFTPQTDLAALRAAKAARLTTNATHDTC